VAAPVRKGGKRGKRRNGLTACGRYRRQIASEETKRFVRDRDWRDLKEEGKEGGEKRGDVEQLYVRTIRLHQERRYKGRRGKMKLPCQSRRKRRKRTAVFFASGSERVPDLREGGGGEGVDITLVYPNLLTKKACHRVDPVGGEKK